MNPTEQHDRHTEITRLDKRIDTLAACVDDEVAERVAEIRQLVTRLTATDRADRVKANDALWERVAQLDEKTTRNAFNVVTVNFYLSQFAGLTLAERLRWVLLGKLPEQFHDFTSDPEAVLFPDQEAIAS
jgi:hypothetical protein